MFSYRHAFHAGSHADILKHLTLIHLVEYLQEKPGALMMVDTHAGAGIYSLQDGFSAISKEADGGIFRLKQYVETCQHANTPIPESIHKYLEYIDVENVDTQLTIYPGSPFILARLLRSQDRLKLFELHPKEIDILRHNIAELKQSRQIDIYAEDSVSIHTKGDFNFRADRDFNLEAGRNFNIASNKDININVNENANIISDSVKINVSGEYNLGATGSIKMASNADINSLAGGENKVSASGKVSVTGANVSIGANGKLSLGASRIIAAAGRIDLNSLPGEAPSNADTPTSPTPLNLFSNPQRDPNVSWTTDRYKGADIISIMQRIPSHEPWDQHENIDPNKYSLARTDSAITPTETAANGAVIEGAPSASTPYPAKAGPAVDRGTVRQQKFSWSTDQPFLTKVKEVAGNLGFSPLDLLACMNLESNRSFDPAIDNGLAKDSAGLGYVGLIQFGNDACSSLKVSKSQLVAMSRVQQMDYVEKYFRLNGWPNKGVSTPTIANIYLTILLPVAKFYSADQIIASASDPKTAKYYTPNSGSFDPSPKKGYFTPTMVAAAVQIHLNEVNACLSKAGVGPDLVVPEAPKTGQ